MGNKREKNEAGIDYFFRVVAPKVTSSGAAIVVVGALFKIMHWPFAGPMLVVGLLTEAVLFFIGTFQPAAPTEVHYHWDRVYPELDPHGEHTPALKPKTKPQGDDNAKGAAVLAGLDKMLGEANLSTDSFKKFGQGIQSLNDTASKMKNMSDAVTATDTYATSVRDASKSLDSLNKAYSNTISAMSEMANASKDAKEFHSQVQKITKNLGALNAVYEMELKDADSHLKAMNKFYGNLTDAMQNMSDVSKESQVFKQQMQTLTGNLTSLNTIYGNMLTAMRGK